MPRWSRHSSPQLNIGNGLHLSRATSESRTLSRGYLGFRQDTGFEGNLRKVVIKPAFCTSRVCPRYNPFPARARLSFGLAHQHHVSVHS